MLLAEAKSDDVLYELGTGDASFLIQAVEEFGIKKAVGFEIMPQRLGLARRKVKERGLTDRITIESRDFYKVKLDDADIIFQMLPEYPEDYKKLYSQVGIRKGTRLIKHDLPLVGFLPDAIEPPFYRMTFPLVRAGSKIQWAAAVLRKANAMPDEVWHELYYYQSVRGYSKHDIRRFQRLLANRLRKTDSSGEGGA